MAIKIGQETQFVDISSKPTKAKVVREGHQVPAVILDIPKATFEIDQLVTVTPRFLPRVISQSIAAGTKVLQNTVVDLVVAPKNVIPFKILDSVHPDLKDHTIDFVDDIVNNTKGRDLLLTYETAGDVPADGKDFLVAQFLSKGIRVDERNPERTFDKAFNSVRAAVAFR